jgi:hypothetical protein
MPRIVPAEASRPRTTGSGTSGATSSSTGSSNTGGGASTSSGAEPGAGGAPIAATKSDTNPAPCVAGETTTAASLGQLHRVTGATRWHRPRRHGLGRCATRGVGVLVFAGNIGGATLTRAGRLGHLHRGMLHDHTTGRHRASRSSRGGGRGGGGAGRYPERMATRETGDPHVPVGLRATWRRTRWADHFTFLGHAAHHPSGV